MAKIIKEETVKIGQTSSKLTDEVTEVDIPKSEAIEKGLLKEEFTYIPDIPAQMIEEPVVTKAEIDLAADTLESEEIIFLRKILKIQEEGCFGRHLNQLIYERIKELKK